MNITIINSSSPIPDSIRARREALRPCLLELDDTAAARHHLGQLGSLLALDHVPVPEVHVLDDASDIVGSQFLLALELRDLGALLLCLVKVLVEVSIPLTIKLLQM